MIYLKRPKETQKNRRKPEKIGKSKKKTVEKDQKKKLKRPERTENKIIRSTVYLLNVYKVDDIKLLVITLESVDYPAEK